MVQASAESLPLVKILLHAAKHPHLSVNGILLGSFSSSGVSISDVIPLFHNSLQLAAPTEMALTQIDAYTERAGAPQVVGYYHSDAKFQPGELTPLAKRMGEKISDKCPGSVILLLDNKMLASYLEQGKDEAASSSSTQLPFLLFWREGKGSSWKREQPGQLSITGGASSVASLRETFFSMFEQQSHRKLVDFDDHFDDLAKDYLNPSFASLGKMALPGQLR